MAEEQEKGLLDMRQIMVGLENLFDPESSTIFDVTMKTNAWTRGHREWLKQELPNWTWVLNRESGTRVVDIKLDKEEKRPNIVAKLVIAGGINPGLITNPRLKAAIPSQIKKELALLILEHLPPHFDVKEPSFKAKVNDTFWLRPMNSRRVWYESEIQFLESGDTIEELCKVTIGQATILEVSRPKGTWSKPCTIILQWFNDVSNCQRWKLAMAIEKRLKEINYLSFHILLEEMLE